MKFKVFTVKTSKKPAKNLLISRYYSYKYKKYKPPTTTITPTTHSNVAGHQYLEITKNCY